VNTTPYVEWLLAHGLEDSTVNVYRGRLAQAETLACGQGWDLRRLDASQLQWLAGQFPQTRSTLGQVKAALIHYWNLEGSTAPTGAIRLPKRVGVEDYRGLEDVDACQLDLTARGRAPDGLAVLMGLYLALRRGEMARLRWEDFDDDMEWVDVFGKGSRRRLLPVHPILRGELERGRGWVFPGRDHQRHAHTGTVYNWIHRVSVDAGIGEVNPHALRHTCLTRMYEETDDVRLVQLFAGHADPATTARYTRVSRRRLQAGIAAVDYQAA
jgi:integrase